jgi:hypothetical protein
MIQFDPPIEKRQINELIGIVYDNAGNWQQEAIERAKKELERRGITENQQTQILRKSKRQYEQRDRRASKNYDKRETESYSAAEMIKVFLLAPFLISGQWFVTDTVFYLNRGNYKRKLHQRIVLLISGVLFWIGVMVLTFKIIDYRMQKKFDRLDRLEELEREAKRADYY